jgi:hypothetical protein
MRSVFTSRITDTIDIPHDPGQSVTIRKLAPRHLEMAAKAQQLKAIGDLKEMGGPAFMKELQGLSDEQRKAVTDPMQRYDRLTLIAKGVTAWTYPEERIAENFEDLDDQTAEFIARAVLKLAKPDLFRTEEEVEAATKNG